jgi:hypothetical protein
MPMNCQLAEAVVAAFQLEKPQALRKHLAAFDERDWMHTKMWLHSSGMARYFLDRMTKLGTVDTMPAALMLEAARWRRLVAEAGLQEQGG